MLMNCWLKNKAIIKVYNCLILQISGQFHRGNRCMGGNLVSVCDSQVLLAKVHQKSFLLVHCAGQCLPANWKHLSIKPTPFPVGFQIPLQ